MLYPHPKILKVMTKVYGRICIIVHQEEFEILDDDKGVIIRLQEPVRVMEVIFVQIQMSLLCLGPQVLPALPDMETHRRQTEVLLGAHEQELVAPPAPGGLHMSRLGLVVLRPGHHPAQDPHTGEQAGLRLVLVLVVSHQLRRGPGAFRRQSLKTIV